MPFRVSYLFAVTTSPQDISVASSHSGGWSESLWCESAPAMNGTGINGTAAKRAGALSNLAAIIGWRVQAYTISGNKLLPGGAQSFKRLYPGANPTMGLPQASLQLNYTVNGGVNVVRYVMRGMPDDAIQYGEFTGGAGNLYAIRVNQFIDETIGGSNPWGSVVRDLSQPSARVLGIAAGVVTLDANIAADGDYLRLRRVVDSITGDPISGAFRIGTKPSANVYPVLGLPTGAAAAAGGTARKDLLVFKSLKTGGIGRAVSRKIGSPFERYRGRRSKRRA